MVILASVVVVVVQQSRFANLTTAGQSYYPDLAASTVAAWLEQLSSSSHANASSSSSVVTTSLRTNASTHTTQQPPPRVVVRPSRISQRIKSAGSGLGASTSIGASTDPPLPLANLSHHLLRLIPEHVARGNASTSFLLPRIPVVVWPLWEFGVDTAEAIHLEQDAITESPFLEFSWNASNFDPNVVWIGDTGSKFKWKEWCGEFQQRVEVAQAQRLQLGLSIQWPIFIVDWTDFFPKQKCPTIEKLVGRDYVSYHQRSIVTGRYWDDRLDWVVSGRYIALSDRQGRTYKHTPLVVRTDTIQNLHDLLHERGYKLKDALEELDRPMDVTHLWPLNPSVYGAGVGDIHSRLRTKVSRTIEAWGRNRSVTTTANGSTVFVGLAGAAVRAGRRGVRHEYIEALLRTKIVVVTQRDRWEDHYRLFEALSSGALVVTDKMLSLPAGLKNGTSIIEFASSLELLTLLEYYLQHRDERVAIARRGRYVAMSRHRTWHRMEEILFGQALTVCSSPEEEAELPSGGDSGGNCPYIVHANETFQRRR